MQYQEIEQLKNGARFATWLTKDPSVVAFSEENNFEILEQDKEDTQCVIAPKKKVSELPLKVVFDHFPEYKQELDSLVEHISGMSIARGVLYLINNHPKDLKNVEKPEVAILLGLFFGYPMCDIRYYVDTRFGNKKPHEMEYVGESVGRVLCEGCAKKYLASVPNGSVPHRG